MASQDKIFVSLVGADPLTRAGIEARLGHRQDIALTAPPTPDGGVTVIVADEADASAIHTIRTTPILGVRRIVLLVGRVDDTGLLAAVEAGVSGIVRRNSDAPILELAIRQAAAGDGTLPPDLLGRLLAQVGRLQRQVLSPRGLTLGGLTEREVAVLRLIADGHDTAEVGRELFFSERTVKNILHDVTTRFELRNRAHAVAYAIREGLI